MKAEIWSGEAILFRIALEVEMWDMRPECGSRRTKKVLTRLYLLLFAFLLATGTPCVCAQTYSPSAPDASPRIAALRKEVEMGGRDAAAQFWKDVKHSGAPLIESVADEPHYSYVTFLWHGDASTRNVVIFDGVAGYDAKDRMVRLADTDVWYKTYKVRNDARFAYYFSPNDPLTSVNEVKGDEAMRTRLAMFQTDPLNPHRCPTTFGAYGSEASFVELPEAPKIAWDESSEAFAHGKVEVTTIQSAILKRDKKLWVYTPANFSAHGRRYPLLVLFDGDRNVMWMPKILDILIAKKKIPPMVMVMTDESVPAMRREELPCNPAFADFLAKELVPWTREKYHATDDPAQTIVAGSSYGGLASVFAGLRHSEIFGNVIALSGSFFWKPDSEKEDQWLVRQMEASPKLPLRFYQEVGLMEGPTFEIKPNQHMRDVLQSKGYPVGYFEFNGGHSYLNWAGGMERGLIFLAKRPAS